MWKDVYLNEAFPDIAEDIRGYAGLVYTLDPENRLGPHGKFRFCPCDQIRNICLPTSAPGRMEPSPQYCVATSRNDLGVVTFVAMPHGRPRDNGGGHSTNCADPEVTCRVHRQKVICAVQCTS